MEVKRYIIHQRIGAQRDRSIMGDREQRRGGDERGGGLARYVARTIVEVG